MIQEQKKLSIAFYWHMHQPLYQLNPDSDFLMPWVRMHAIKDYLDMLLIINEFPKLKLNFNFVPILIDSILKYGENGFHDVHSKLSVSAIEDLTIDDKRFILNNFFDANYSSMIAHHPEYNALYKKRLDFENPEDNVFSNQDYSDIMAWFNLAWFDPIYKRMYPELNKFVEKGFNFTLEDRKKIIEYQREIIRKIIPAYKAFLESGRIELTTSPYFHPILPILTDIKCAQRNIPNAEVLPTNLKMAEDAKLQTKRALDRIEEVFGVRPKGIWPPEHCLSSKTLEMLKEIGIKWTITDEGILANSINFEFVRDFKGYLEDPYFLLKTYEYGSKSEKIDLIFRDSLIPNLINFEYPTTDATVAANDLYDRIKVIQSKILVSPDNKHLLTIALDGENCWENYPEDGGEFLRKIYGLIENDSSLETVLISDYIEKDKNKKQLNKIYSGSWINRNFQLWIGEPTKDKAWNYLKKVRDDFSDFSEKNPTHPNLEKAQIELHAAEGSDWFWWYGEPNHSGQDHIFDYLFREHLKNIYKLLDLSLPYFLETPLSMLNNSPSKYPTSNITPIMDGQDKIDDEWLNAGIINMPASETETNLFEKIKFGFDKENLYLRFFINNEVKKNNSNINHEMYIYLKNNDKNTNFAFNRLLNKDKNISSLTREKFQYEIKLAVINGMLRPLQFSKATKEGLWTIQENSAIKIAYDKVIDISIPLNSVLTAPDGFLEFIFMSSKFDVLESFMPHENLLMIQRHQ